MKIQIKNRYTDKIIIEGEYKDIKECVEQNKANLRRADLRKADLSEADLREANLCGADLREARIKITQKDDIIKGLNIRIE